MGHVVLLSFTAAVNPTLVAAATIMLLMRNPSRLLLGYWLGAMMTSITLGLLIVFALEGTSVAKTTQHTLSPSADIVLGAVGLILALVIRRGPNERVSERRARRKQAKRGRPPPRWERMLDRGSPKATFVVGALLTLPGASYLGGLTALSRLGYSTAVTVLVVVCFNLVMLALLEVPMLAFAIAPEWTRTVIDRAKAWLHRHGREAATWGFATVGTALVIKGIIGLL